MTHSAISDANFQAYTYVYMYISISQESFNVEMIRKCYQDITNLKNKYHEKQRKYKNAYNKLSHASTGASSVGVISGVSTIGTASTSGCGITNQCVIRCCQHCFNLCWGNSAVII